MNTLPKPEQNEAAARFRRLVVVIIAGAALLRIIIALNLPSLSRDGVTFCWFAENLKEHGFEYLRDPQAHQHPFFPTLIVFVHGVLSLFFAADSPLVYQAAGQVVSVAAGVAVVALTGAFTLHWFRRAMPEIKPEPPTLAAMALAALLGTNVWLSADAMSDQLHLALYLAAVLCLIRSDSLYYAFGCGAFAALAFLTRPEGIVPIIAAFIVLSHRTLQARTAKSVTRLAAAVGTFALLAAPYWYATGTLTNKKDVFAATSQAAKTKTAHLQSNSSEHEHHRPPLLAKLELRDVPLVKLLPETLRSIFRAGRVVIPLLAIAAFFLPGVRWRTPASAAVFLCILGHTALAILLLERYHYQQPRHLLPVVALITPLAGIALAGIHEHAKKINHIWPHIAAIFLIYLPLALYAVRLPNYAERFWRVAANELRDENPQLASTQIMSGSAGRILAFYSDAEWIYWPEDATRPDLLARQLKESKPEYFAIVIGPGGETIGNDEIAATLERGDLIDAPLVSTLRMPMDRDQQMRVYRFNWDSTIEPNETPKE